MSNFLDLANSWVLFVLVAIALALVAVQAVLFIRTAMKRGKELGMTKAMFSKVITNSAVFSILPSLPIILTMLAMMPALGKFIPWLRLSVIGSAMYESMSADIAIKELGFTGLGDLTLTPDGFASVVMVMTLGAMTAPVLNTLFLKKLDTKLKGLMSGGGFMTVAVGAIFIGFMAVQAIPRFISLDAPIQSVVTITAGISAILLDYIGKKTKLKAISEFSFPFAMILGMIAAIVYSSIIA